MCEKFTRIELFFLKDQVNHWLRFGNFNSEKYIDRRRAFAWFKPKETFCYIRWWANDYGTQEWTLGILRSCLPNERNIQSYPGLSPGAEVLLHVKGPTYVKRILCVFDEIEECGINLCEVSPSYYRYLGQCITNRKSPHSYKMEQHIAFQTSLKAML